MVRKKDVLATVMQSFAITCLVTVLWMVIGYSLAFTPGSSAFLGGMDRVSPPRVGVCVAHDAMPDVWSHASSALVLGDVSAGVE
jgi:ammonium transporter, Amt family